MIPLVYVPLRLFLLQHPRDLVQKSNKALQGSAKQRSELECWALLLPHCLACGYIDEVYMHAVVPVDMPDSTG